MRNPTNQHSYVYDCTQLLLLLLMSPALISCAGIIPGRDAPHNLITLELKHMSEYQQLIDQKIAAEQAYYDSARKELSENLRDTRRNQLTNDFIDRKAITTVDQWRYSPKPEVTEQDLLVFIDSVSADYQAAQAKILQSDNTVNDQYLNTVEKLEYQRMKLQQIQTSLREVDSRMTPQQKAEFYYNYVQGIRDELKKLKTPPDTTAKDSGTPSSTTSIGNPGTN